MKCIYNFLTYQRQRVLVQGSESSWARVQSGLLEVSVLGPILFVCYINDMPVTISYLIYMYVYIHVYIYTYILIYMCGERKTDWQYNLVS